jgi:hypothetical protein
MGAQGLLGALRERLLSVKVVLGRAMPCVVRQTTYSVLKNQLRLRLSRGRERDDDQSDRDDREDTNEWNSRTVLRLATLEGVFKIVTRRRIRVNCSRRRLILNGIAIGFTGPVMCQWRMRTELFREGVSMRVWIHGASVASRSGVAYCALCRAAMHVLHGRRFWGQYQTAQLSTIPGFLP